MNERARKAASRGSRVKGATHIAAVSRDANSWDAFYWGYVYGQGSLHHIRWSAAAGVVGPQPVTGAAGALPSLDSGSGLSVISRAPNMLKVFYISSGALQYVHSENSGSTWNSYPVSGIGMFWADSRVVAISRDRYSFHLFIAPKMGNILWLSYTDDPFSENYGWGVNILPTAVPVPEHAAITVGCQVLQNGTSLRRPPETRFR